MEVSPGRAIPISRLHQKKIGADRVGKGMEEAVRLLARGAPALCDDVLREIDAHLRSPHCCECGTPQLRVCVNPTLAFPILFRLCRCEEVSSRLPLRLEL